MDSSLASLTSALVTGAAFALLGGTIARYKRRTTELWGVLSSSARGPLWACSRYRVPATTPRRPGRWSGTRATGSTRATCAHASPAGSPSGAGSPRVTRGCHVPILRGGAWVGPPNRTWIAPALDRTYGSDTADLWGGLDALRRQRQDTTRRAIRPRRVDHGAALSNSCLWLSSPKRDGARGASQAGGLQRRRLCRSGDRRTRGGT